MVDDVSYTVQEGLGALEADNGVSGPSASESRAARANGPDRRSPIVDRQSLTAGYRAPVTGRQRSPDLLSITEVRMNRTNGCRQEKLKGKEETGE
jgi:hypothetical protein